MKISLAAQHIVKHYGGVIALSDGSLDVQSGEVLALMGANGSGKSTLSKVIAGVVAPDEGQLLLDGKQISFASPQVARKYGIAVVYQDLSLIPDMTVAENIWLAHELMAGRSLLRKRDMRSRTQFLLDLFTGTVSSSLRPDARVTTLSSDEKQIVEILKALSLQPRMMILDEATASLDSRQVHRLFQLIENWKAQDMAIVFVSHRMDEIFHIADRAAVLRSGKTVATTAIRETNEQKLVSLMIDSAEVARQVKQKETISEAPVRLAVNSMQTQVLHDISFTLHDGELLGLGGLRGQGQSDLLLALFGAVPFKGTITLSGQQVHFTHPRQAMQARMAFVPGDRGSEGLLPIRSILENLQLPSWRRYGSFLQIGKARKDATTVADKLHLVMGSLDAPVNSLSGGNAQKVVLGKWLLRNPAVLLLDDPTKGIDVGAKKEFYSLLAELREAGTAILIYSSDDEELLGLCERVLVLHDGRVQAELVGNTLTRADLVAASMGAGRQNEKVV